MKRCRCYDLKSKSQTLVRDATSVKIGLIAAIRCEVIEGPLVEWLKLPRRLMLIRLLAFTPFGRSISYRSAEVDHNWIETHDLF